MVYELLKGKNLKEILKANKNTKLLPEYSDRKAWANLPEDTKQHFKKSAGILKNKQYGILPASFYIEFTKTGNRSIYENVYFERREDLMMLTIAECIFEEGEFIDKIIDLVWAICEETSWVPSAHNNKGEIPDIEHEIYVDLFAAETGSAISWVYYFLGNIIEQTSPTVKRRMEIEVDRRILTPYLQYNHFWYMGLESDRPVNNWNPWINSNVITAFYVFEKDINRLTLGIEKTIKTIDAFIKTYHSDGACDEGPGYFGVAGASLFDYLEILSVMTNNQINVYENELLKNMARYIYRVYIGNGYFVNFADGSSRAGAPSKLLARVGEAVGDDNLTGFANEIPDKANKKNSGFVSIHYCIYRTVKSLFQKEDKNKNFTPPKTHWFDGTEILIARDSEGSASGMFIAAKGGHNDESHNHNDVGHFILYSDGKPVIIDIGVETYTQKTFSSERYDIWTMQSRYHNLPEINGFNQSEGRNFHASDVCYNHDNNNTVLSMQLKNAYPDNAEIESYKRKFVFEHGKSFTVHDKYSLKKYIAPLVFNLMCLNKPEIDGNIINLGENTEMFYDNKIFSASVEEIELTDSRLKHDWQANYLYRIQLTEITKPEINKENEIILLFKNRK